MSDNETKYHCYRLCRAAGLPERGWHSLRHAYGMHAAMFGVNPWKLMLSMGAQAHRSCARNKATMTPTRSPRDAQRARVPRSAWQCGGSKRGSI